MDDHWYLLKIARYSKKLSLHNIYKIWSFCYERYNTLFIKVHCTTWDRVSISIYEYGNKCHLEGNYFLQDAQRVVTNSYQTSTQKVNDVITLHETPFCVHWNGKDIFGALPLHNIYCTQWIVKIQDDDSKYNPHSSLQNKCWLLRSR